MKSFNRLIQTYLIYALPVVVATVVWGSFQSDIAIRAKGFAPAVWLWEVMSWSLLLWVLCLLIFMVMLVFRKETQESVIRRLVGMRERDEREEVITGFAARRAFLATMGLLIGLLFLSCFTITVARLPNETVDGKKSSLSIGFRFTGVDTKTTTSSDGNVIYEHHDLPLSKSAILLTVLVWQVAAFRLQARREWGAG